MAEALTGSMAIALLAAVIGLIVLAYLFHWFYQRSTKETAFVRTGMGGETVVINGGALVLPIIHEITPVSLNVTRIQVDATHGEALITRDRMRVDIAAEFFVRVAQNRDAVAAAAPTLGRRATDPNQMADLLSGKFIAALRAAAAEMDLDAMHERRADYVDTVAARAADALALNGLELESVAITHMDQTALEHFNPANRFDADGLTRLVETIEARRAKRNEIEQDAMVAIRARNLEAEKETLKIEEDGENARLAQERAVETARAHQAAEIAQVRAAQEAEAERARIDQERAVRREQIQQQNDVDAADIAAREDVERARIVSDRQLRDARILADEESEKRDIQRRIAIAEASIAQAEAEIVAEAARARAVEATEKVDTVREVELAERSAAIDKLLAAKDAETARLAAEAERVTAAAAAEALKLKNEAENLLSEDARAAQLRAKMIDHLEGVIRESVRPLENIEGIKILHVDGLGGGGDRSLSPTDEVIESALRYRAQAPLIDEMMKEIGVENSKVSGMGDIFRSARDAQSLAKETKPKKTGE